jgi:hypothetical protein
MDEGDRADALIRRNRWLLALAAEARAAACEALVTAEHVRHIVQLNRIERERREALGRRALQQTGAYRG